MELTREQVYGALALCPALPYCTTKEFVTALESGAESFMFVRTSVGVINGANTVLGAAPLVFARVIPGAVKCGDAMSDTGDRFRPSGYKLDGGTHRIVRECDWEAALEQLGITKSKPKIDTKPELCILDSDKAGIARAAAVPKPTPAPPFMVQLPKNSDGLLTILPIWRP